MLTLDGVPLFYNGMEVGDATESGAPALFEKVPIFWEPKERPPLREIYRSLIRLRTQHPAFTNDRVVWVDNSQPTDVVTFMRQDSTDQFLVVINFSNRPVVDSVDVQNAGEFRPVKIDGMPESRTSALDRLELNGFEWRIFHQSVPK
jgi:cyclomaltodextrinase / maltogenic alpha-amylase / neopullulanase